MVSHATRRISPVLRRTLVLLGALALMGLPLYAQTAMPPDAAAVAASAQHLGVDEILARHYEAIGGDHHQQVQTMRMDGRSIMAGMETSYTRYSKRPNKVLLEIQVPGMTGVQAFDGEVAWAFMPFMGQNAPAALPPAQAQAVLEGSEFDGPLVHSREKGHEVKLLGTEAVGDRNAYVLEVAMKTGGVQTHYVDAETFYVTRSVSAEGEALFLDYRLIDGHPVPTVVEMLSPMGEQTIYVDEVTFDVEIVDAEFTMQ